VQSDNFRVIQCSDDEFTVLFGLWLSLVLDMWNIAGHVLVSYIGRYLEITTGPDSV
jgi:hypothetical protein